MPVHSPPFPPSGPYAASGGDPVPAADRAPETDTAPTGELGCPYGARSGLSGCTLTMLVAVEAAPLAVADGTATCELSLFSRIIRAFFFEAGVWKLIMNGCCGGIRAASTHSQT